MPINFDIAPSKGAPAKVCAAKFRGEEEPQHSERAVTFYKKVAASDTQLAATWRRVRDSNPRSLSGHSISSAAPSTTRTTLHIEFFQHRLARPSDKCKISMQDKREKFRYTPRIQPRVKPNPADESARKPQTFESRLFDHLSTAPYSPAHKRAILYYNRFGGPRQRETRSKRGGRAKGGSAGLRGPGRASRPGGRGRGAAGFSFAPFGARPAFFPRRAPA